MTAHGTGGEWHPCADQDGLCHLTRHIRECSEHLPKSPCVTLPRRVIRQHSRTLGPLTTAQGRKLKQRTSRLSMSPTGPGRAGI